MEVERNDLADVLPAPSRWNFAELKLRACQIQRSARLNRKQKKLTNLLIFTFPSIALRVEGLWARDKPDYRVPRAGGSKRSANAQA